MHTDADGNPNLWNVNHDDDDRWLDNDNGRADNVWNPDNRFVFLRRNSLHFSPVLRSGEFCFVSCPFHPPSIRPTSSSLSDKAMYFLLSSDFVSQRMRRSTLSVSTLRIA